MTAAPPFIVKGPRGVGYVPTIQADGSIQWAPAGSGGGGGAPSGPAGGDLAGTYPNPTVAAGAVTPAKLSFDPATQTELDAEATARTAADAAHVAAADPHPGYRLESAPIVSADIQDATITVGDLAFDPATQAELNAHEADTTAIHGIADTASLVLTGDARLSDARAPTAHKATHVSGGADAFVATDLIDAVVKRLRESGGPTDLTLGAVADGEYLHRAGATIVGGTPAGGGGSPLFRPRFRSGRWYSGPVLAATTTGTAMLNILTVIPLVVADAITIDQIAISVSTGAATGVVRLGIYSDDGTCFPGALLLDAGTVDASTTGDKALALTPLALAVGYYWLAAVPQVVETKSKVQNAGSSLFTGATFNDLSNSKARGYQQTGVTGALPANFTTTETQANNPILIGVRVA